METMANWFGLRDGHYDFSIENDQNADLFFARHELNQRLQQILRKAARTGNPPKMVLYGDWGVGKTHTMRHLQYIIRQNSDLQAQSVFVELPDVESKSTFQVAHASLMDALGFDRVRTWMSHYQAREGENSFLTITEYTQSNDIAKAFSTLPTFGDVARIAWDWLCGTSLSAADARSAGLPPRLEQSQAFVSVLRMLGVLSREIDGKMLVLMIDEATKIQNVTNPDANNHWKNAFKLLADPALKDLGLVISASFRDIDDFPDPLHDLQVQGRFGEEHYIQLLNFDDHEARDFSKALLSAFVDPDRAESILAAHLEQAENESVEPFPFTSDAFGVFVEYSVRRGGITTPRELQKTLDDVLNRAMDDGVHILCSRYMNEIVSGA